MNIKNIKKRNFNAHFSKKKSISPQNNIESINLKIQSPLFKIFMDNNKLKKVHLVKSTMNSKEEKLQKSKLLIHNYNINNKAFLNPRLISFKILESKYNMTPKLFSDKIIFNLVLNKKCHLVSYFHEIVLCDNTLKEHLKKSYKYNESKDKIQKYFICYQNYLNFFCKPYFVDFILNKKMLKHMEKIAQFYYSKIHALKNQNINKGKSKEEKNKGKDKKDLNLNLSIFNNRVIEDIEKVNIFTVVSSEDANREIQIMTNKIKSTLSQKYFEFETEITPISTSGEGKNYPPQSSKENQIVSMNENVLLNSGDTINHNNLIKNIKIIETSNSLNALISELKENKNKGINYNNFKNKNIIINNENNRDKLKENIINEVVFPSDQKNKETKELNTPRNINLKITKKIDSFKYPSDKLYLNNKFFDKKSSNIDKYKLNDNNYDIKKIINDENACSSKRMINNFNINLNQILSYHKIITSIHDKTKGKENKKEKINNKNNLLNEIKSILKVKNSSKHKNNLQSMDLKSETRNKLNHNINSHKKKMKLKLNYNNEMKQKLKRINSMAKISSQEINKNKVKGRNKSIIRDGRDIVVKNKDCTSTLLKIGGRILENHGIITIRQNGSSSRKDINDKNLFRNFTITKISVMNSLKKEIGTKCNSLSVNRNTNNIGDGYINSHKNYNIKRSISPTIKRHKIFSSGLLFNSTNDKIIKSALPSSNRSIIKKEGKNKNNYLYLNNIEILHKNELENNFLGRKFGKEESKLKLKYFKYIQKERKDKNGFTPKKNIFGKTAKYI